MFIGNATRHRSCPLFKSGLLVVRRPSSFVRQTLLVILLVWCLSFAANAAPTFLPDIPDFYQHQKSGSDAANLPYKMPTGVNPVPRPATFTPGYANPTDRSWWEWGYNPNTAGSTGGESGGWCCVAAFTNAFYFWDIHGFSGLFNHGGVQPLLNRANFAIEDLAVDFFGMNGTAPVDIPDYIHQYIPSGGPTYSEYFLDSASGHIKRSNDASNCGAGLICDPALSADTGFTSFFPLYKNLIDNGQTVMLYIEGGAGTWWNTSFHVVTGAGWDNNTVYFADPNDTARGANWGAQYVPGDTLVPAAGATDAEREAFYSKATIGADGMTFADGTYPTSRITRLYVLAAPEAAVYTFTKIADTTTIASVGKFIHLDDSPAISGSTAAFRGVSGSGEGIFTGSGGSLTTIVKQGDTTPIAPTLVFGSFSNTAISGSTAAFRGTYSGGQGIFTGNGGPLTTIAITGGQVPTVPSGIFTGFNGSPAISGNLVAFHGNYSDGSGNSGQGIFTGAGSPLTKIAKTGDSVPTVTSGKFTSFDFSNLRSISGDTVSFIGNYNGGSGVFTGNGASLTKIAKSGETVLSSTFVSFQSTAISDDTVAFIGTYTGGIGVFAGDGGPLTTIAKQGDPAPSGTFTNFDGPAISGMTVAFHGTYLGGSGIFAGTGGLLTTVIKTGDPLFGSTVNGLSSSSIGASGLDAGGSGNLAFLYTLADGRSGVAIAMPIIAMKFTGDYNGDGTVDSADYVTWRRSFGQNVIPGQGADGTKNGVIDNGDYAIWRANFGNTAGVGSGSGIVVAVSEPPSWSMLRAAGVGVILASTTRRRSQSVNIRMQLEASSSRV
jgi:hypothetical protein